jgi:methionyl-tRNA formyltransferase
LAAAGHDVRLAVTRPPIRRGRGGATSPTAVEVRARALGIPVGYDLSDAPDSGAELGIVVAYGRIIGVDVLDRLAMINIHFSLLPRWRGAAPVERAILAGDNQTGVCLMDVEKGLDTGAVYRRRETAIGESETAEQLTGRLARIGADLLVEALGEGLGEPVPQEGEPTYAAKITAEDLHLDWSQSAENLCRTVRIGRAWTTVNGKRLLVLDARPGDTGQGPTVPAGDGAVTLLTVQPEGRRAMPATEWARGAGAAAAFD